MTSFRYRAFGAAALACGLLAGCERPPVDTVQQGFRGTGMVEVYNPRTLAAQQALNTPPVPTPAASDDGPRASEVYKNVKVLGDLSVAQFTRLMVAMTTWVSPEQGCGYCHNLQNLADDSSYAKVVARRMLQMNQHVNSGWKQHVGVTGVTCYTCHRGHPVPQQVWFTPPEPQRNDWAFSLGDDAGQNRPARNIGLASLPYDPYTPFLLAGDSIRVIGKTALPTGNRHSIKEAEWTYALMMHFSKSLGVNCTYCHNTRSFASWEGPPQRVNAWYGIRMVRDLNGNYLEPLTKVFPRDHLGPEGDVAKIGCSTCHQGAYKPLWGARMLPDYPALAVPLKTAAPAAPAPASAVAAAAQTAARRGCGGTDGRRPGCGKRRRRPRGARSGRGHARDACGAVNRCRRPRHGGRARPVPPRPHRPRRRGAGHDRPRRRPADAGPDAQGQPLGLRGPLGQGRPQSRPREEAGVRRSRRPRGGRRG